MAERPHDWSVRLAHADWLEERGDPRAELVRLTYEVLHGHWGESARHARLAELYHAGLILPTPQMKLDSGLTLRLIPPGSFTMGTQMTDGESDEKQMTVTLTRGFWLGQYTATQREWKTVMGSEPWSGQRYVKKGANCPATYVSWEQAQQFCRVLTEEDWTRRVMGPGLIHALPTEAQWEYACRAGTTSAYSFGVDSAQLRRYAWYEENGRRVGKLHARRVGQKQANPWGLFDMHGNVWEWCQDVGVDSLPGGVDPLATSGASGRVCRGASWDDFPRDCRSASRYWCKPSLRSNNLGFRVAAAPSGD